MKEDPPAEPRPVPSRSKAGWTGRGDHAHLVRAWGVLFVGVGTAFLLSFTVFASTFSTG